MTQSAALALTARDERRIADAFRHRGALTGSTAQPLRTLGLLESRALLRMVTDATVRRAGPNRYFLDEGVWARRRRIQWRNVLRTVVVGLLVAAGAALFVASR